jgi:hypothetical protein
MKTLIQQNADVLGLNSISLMISFTEVEQFLQIILLSISIIYTIEKYITYRKNKKNT